jgi:prepilin-type N-terminal cleavage/methylation domain-containing protein
MVRRSARGFTLVELMVVVAIVGVLATVGVYAVRKYVLAAKTSEATEIINSIRAAQEQYKDERFRYLNVSSVDKTSGSFFPFSSKADLSDNKKVAWATGTSGIPALWAELGIRPSTAVQFGYACSAGQGAGVPSQATLGTSVNLNYPDSASDWYVARAMADRTGSQTYTIVVGSSFTDAIHIDNEAD